jgi:hypothetical protein
MPEDKNNRIGSMSDIIERADTASTIVFGIVGAIGGAVVGGIAVSAIGKMGIDNGKAWVKPVAFVTPTISGAAIAAYIVSR